MPLAFALATVVPLISVILAFSRSRVSQEMALVFLALWVVLLPSLPIFVFVSGRHFAKLCQAGGLHSLAPWHRRIANTLAIGVCIMNAGFAILLMALLAYFDSHPPQAVLPLMAVSIYGGLLVAGIGFIAATVLLFRTARAFRHLADSVTTPLTAPASASESTTA